MHRLFAASSILLTLTVAACTNSAPAGPASPLEGKPAPDFTFSTPDGKSFKLSDQKGSVVLVDTWATWCGPCQQSLPHIQKISDDKDLAKQGLVVWAVNLQEDKSDIQKFITDNKYTFTVLMDKSGEMGKNYSVSAIPCTFVIGRDGVIKNVFVGFNADESPKEIDEAVAKALAEPKPG